MLIIKPSKFVIMWRETNIRIVWSLLPSCDVNKMLKNDLSCFCYFCLDSNYKSCVNLAWTKAWQIKVLDTNNSQIDPQTTTNYYVTLLGSRSIDSFSMTRPPRHLLIPIIWFMISITPIMVVLESNTPTNCIDYSLTAFENKIWSLESLTWYDKTSTTT
jgi:hypothetical protein